MATPNQRIMYGNGLVGFGIQRDIGKTTIYRMRHGNGHYGAKLHKLYQDKYDYFVPSTITHPNGDAARTCFTNAIAAWQTLPDADKKRFNDWAAKIRNLSGFNLFIRHYIKENY